MSLSESLPQKLLSDISSSGNTADFHHDFISCGDFLKRLKDDDDNNNNNNTMCLKSIRSRKNEIKQEMKRLECELINLTKKEQHLIMEWNEKDKISLGCVDKKESLRHHNRWISVDHVCCSGDHNIDLLDALENELDVKHQEEVQTPIKQTLSKICSKPIKFVVNCDDYHQLLEVQQLNKEEQSKEVNCDDKTNENETNSLDQEILKKELELEKTINCCKQLERKRQQRKRKGRKSEPSIVFDSK
ncbi:hypothetical protein QTN25_008701 [Entamoeba marina]